MTDVRLRARSVSELVDAAFALYRRGSNQYIPVMAVATIPQLVSRLFLRSDGTLGLGSNVFALVTLLISSLTYMIGSAAIMKLGSEVYLGEQADVGATVRGAGPHRIL